MVDVRRSYAPADRVCLTLGIGIAFAAAGLIWLVTAPLGGFAILGLGVIAAVAGMLLAGACARSKERDLLGIGRRLGIRRAGKAPAETADDPFRGMERHEHGRDGPPAGEDGRDA